MRLKKLNIDTLLETGKFDGIRLVDVNSQCVHLTEYRLTIFDPEEQKYYQGTITYGLDFEAFFEEVQAIPSNKMEYVPLTTEQKEV